MSEQFWPIALGLIIVIILFWPSTESEHKLSTNPPQSDISINANSNDERNSSKQEGGALVRYYPSYWRSHFFPYRGIRYWGRYPRYYWWDRWVPRQSTYYW